ncbi:MAG: hypothetical protein JXO49_08635 [Deltaproteobacteria bacterium]|nr:hypothetical protein [Candidatus Anaeroferrophillus wilburensis]MBN2889394.1 hypothetical protein [Deltaproteobacteria bacterium]
MNDERATRSILITGDLATGKTTLLLQLETVLRKRYRLAGVANIASPRAHRSAMPAGGYDFRIIPSGESYSWAARRENGFDFNRQNLAVVLSRLRAVGDVEVCLLDDIGPLELAGDGFDSVIRKAAGEHGPLVILVVKKRCLEDVVRCYGLSSSEVYDLDQRQDHEKIIAEICHDLENRDARNIAAFSVLAGLTEVGVGSVLHAVRVPFKGHFLALVQVMMMIGFGRRLNGRGLYQIAFIAALLKSFSPAGPRLKPMFYIFTQGALFALPTSIFGWHFPAMLGGAMLTSVSTVFLSLGFSLLKYGRAYFEMLETAFNRIIAAAGWGPYPLGSILLTFLLIKILLAVGITLAAYHFDFSFIERRLARIRKLVAHGGPPVELPRGRKRSWKASAVGACRDMGRIGFLVPFGITVTLICIFSNLHDGQLLVMLLRALLVTWLGFMLIRQINPLSLVHFFRQRGARGFALAMNHSLTAWSVYRQEGEKDD